MRLETLFGVTVCLILLATTAAMIAYAPTRGVNEVVAGHVYSLLYVILGALLGRASNRREP
jgi:hypothetical protein